MSSLELVHFADCWVTGLIGGLVLLLRCFVAFLVCLLCFKFGLFCCYYALVCVVGVRTFALRMVGLLWEC